MRWLSVLALVFTGAEISASAGATADGPDHYRLTGVTKGDSAALRADANASAPVVGQIPSGSLCLRNLGCRGGVSYEGFADMRRSEQQRQERANPRWCQIEHQGVVGWLEGRYLTESKCPTATAPAEGSADDTTSSPSAGTSHADRHTISFPQGRGQVRVKGRVEGDQTVDYRVRVHPGQTLSITLKGAHGQNYFDVLPFGSDAAIFIGSSAGKHYERVHPVEGEYIVRVYLMRAAAQRNNSSSFGLTVALTGGLPVPAPDTQTDDQADAGVVTLLPVESAVSVQRPRATAVSPDRRTIKFAQGQGRVRLKGRIEGSETFDYRVHAGAGQTLSVTLRGSHGQNYFNVLPPESEAAMFIGSTSGNRCERMVPVEGDYVIRVYLMRAAARRNDSSNFGLDVALSGGALTPLPEAQDARIVGTPFHASAAVNCDTGLGAGLQQCEARVIRHGVDGTASVEVRSPSDYLRRILFIKGQVMASDSMNPVTATRRGDFITISFPGGERVDLHDALISGG